MPILLAFQKQCKQSALFKTQGCFLCLTMFQIKNIIKRRLGLFINTNNHEPSQTICGNVYNIPCCLRCRRNIHLNFNQSVWASNSTLKNFNLIKIFL